MTNGQITTWDPAEHLRSEEDMAAYLEAAKELREPKLIAAARRDVERAKSIQAGAPNTRTHAGKN